MEFFIDVDGVLLDLDPPFIVWLKKNHLPNLPANLPLKSLMHQVDADFEDFFYEFMKDESFSMLPPLVDKEQFNWLSARYNVNLITNLPNYAEDLRIKNLKSCGFIYHNLIRAGLNTYNEPDYLSKGATIQKLRSKKQVVFLDDYKLNCQEVKKMVPDSQVFLLSAKKKADEFQRVASWLYFLNQLPLDLPKQFKV